MSSATTFYDLKAETPKGDFNFADTKGKVVLIVNVASKCGFTSQYEGLEKLYKEYKDRNFLIVGFPCNQFGGQEPGTDDEVAQFCQLNYGVSFPMAKKSDVNGAHTNEVFKYLKAHKSYAMGMMDRVRWNFEKFLISKDGQVLERYSSLTKPEDIKADIEKALAA